ncbi:MAG: hypothetical protein HY062_09015 [Bacteroidetes bacterium]|nr:hypothetical protein [Bacteroidota bacterium]
MKDLIEKIINENNDYLEKLVSFKTSEINPELFKNDKWIKTSAEYSNIKNKTIGELENTINELNIFLQELLSQNRDIKTELLKLHHMFGLTNGKYYDYALNHDIYAYFEIEFHSLIKSKLDKYLLLEQELNNGSL